MSQTAPLPSVVAHRGASSVAPQNTLAAYEAAWRAGAPAIELDVRLTADGVPVLIHDAHVDDVTDGTGLVAELDLATLRSLDAGVRFSPAFAGQRIPTLDEALTFLTERPGVELLCEYKGAWTPEQVAPTTAAIDAAGLAGRTLVQSFRRVTISSLREAAGHLPRGLLCKQPTAALLNSAHELEVATINPAVAAVLAEPQMVSRLHGSGFQVMPWTANATTEWADLVDARVDAIITDRPAELGSWLRARPCGDDRAA